MRHGGLRAGRVAVVLGVVALSAAFTAGVSGCSSGNPPVRRAVAAGSGLAMLRPTVTASVRDGQTEVSPAQPVTVSVAGGAVRRVTLLNPENAVVPGAVSPDGASWHSTERLGYRRTYRLRVEAVGLAGVSDSVMTFRTVAPGNVTKPYPVPLDGELVGIGQPVVVQFDENIADRWAAQNAVTVATDPPVPGAFYWVSNRELHWRPEKYWAPGTKVRVDVAAYGKHLGAGVFGQDDAHVAFAVGDPVIYTADDATKQVTVTRNGQVIRTMPTSMGKSSTPTPNGIYLVGNRVDRMVMDSSTYGVPVHSAAGYRVNVDYATQLSYNGIYMHSAPWSLWAQGSQNTSHGCLNLSPSNAEWVVHSAKRGDIVVVRNTQGPVLDGADGLGDWNMPWAQWKAGNAGPAPAPAPGPAPIQAAGTR
ncbi:MAG: L,D-transpeptidase [Mycobacteriaceae bacterium]|nr:L,D-transpeptidase [Mycobacteriaceae bacterium]